MASTSNKFLVIGAGPSGIAAGAALKQQQIPFDIVDKGSQVGGIWDISRPDGPMYKSCHFISSRTLSGFPDFPMPGNYPDYPNHQLILQYIQSYATHHGLHPYIQFNTTVHQVTPENNLWKVTLGKNEVRLYKGVIVANGREWYPSVPAYDTVFEGETMHTQQYKSPDIFTGKRVLIVGAGNSGCDIACDAATHAGKAFISMRRCYYFIPKYLFGKPTDVFAHEGPQLPDWLEKPVFSFLLNKIVVGNLKQYGLPKPDHQLLQSHPIINDQLLHYLGHGDIQYKPDIVSFRGKTVVFKDGSEEEIDLLVFATGYQNIFPFIDEGVLTLNSRGIPDLYLNVFDKHHEHLYFIGFLNTDGAAYPLIAKQLELVSTYIRLADNQPAKAQKLRSFIQHDKTDFHKGRYLATHRHSNYVKNIPYLKYLQKLSKKFNS